MSCRLQYAADIGATSSGSIKHREKGDQRRSGVQRITVFSPDIEPTFFDQSAYLLLSNGR